MGIWYATVEDVKQALDVKATAITDRQIGRALESASRNVDGLCNRVFYPEIDTRYFDWPNQQYAWPQNLWLDQNEVLSVTTLSSGGRTISSSDYFLEPNTYGPPYDRISLNLSTSSYYGGGATWQRAITVTGVFGFCNDTEAAGTLATAISSTSATTMNVSDSSLIGIGDLVLIDSEYLVVTGKSMLTTGQTLQTPLTASASNTTVAVTDGTAFHAGEFILLDSERMFITDIAGNNLTVKRQWDGSTLAAHTGSTIYVPRTLSVTRGVLGTTSATHLISTALNRHVVPGLVHDLTVAEAIVRFEQETAGYARTVGSGDNVRNASLAGLEDLRAATYERFGRKSRVRAI